jgi:tetratricopeptide (TPR) repeat protein
MEAYISGSAGIAAVVNGVNTELYQLDKVDPIIIKTHEVKHIFSSNEDVIFLKKTTKTDVLKKLKKESNKSNCLMLFLMILDSDIDNESKHSLAEHINYLFIKDTEAYEYVCNVIFSRSLPNNSILSIPDVILPEFNRVYDLLTSLFDNQSAIKTCSELFSSICTDRNLSAQQSSYVEGLLVNQGFFFTFASNQADLSFLHKIHFLLSDKLKSIGVNDFVHFTSCIRTQFKSLVNSKLNGKNKSSNKEEVGEQKLYTSKRQAKLKKVNKKDAYTRVQKQLAVIKLKLREQSILPAKNMAADLVASQLKSKDDEFAALSLCQLSEYAKHLNLYKLQLEWALRATEVAPQDYRTFGHVADAYINLEDINSAKKYFEICLKAHDHNRIYGLTGLARIERSRSNLAKSMTYIDLSIKECGKDSVPYLIKAELLRDQFQYKESEELYDYICRTFPESSIAQCGKAALFADQKKFIEAESAYILALKNYPANEEQPRILSGLGFLYARLGRFEEAHKHLDQSIALCSYEDIIPMISKSKALQMQGRFKESESTLKSLLIGRAQFSDVVEQLLQLYLETNDLVKAHQLYATLNEEIKRDDLVQVRYSQLLRQENNFSDALQIIDRIRARKPRHTLAMNERAAILKFQGKYKQAEAQYKEVIKVSKFDRTAKFGLQAINHIFKKEVKLESIIATDNIENPLTIDDYQTIGNIGLLKLAKGDIKEGKKLLLQSCNSNFKSLQIKFNSGLSLASLMLNQTNAALKPINKPNSIVGLIQRTLVYGEQGKKEQVINGLKLLSHNTPPFVGKVMDMINKKYSVAANDENITQSDIYQEQINNMLIAA